MLLDSQWNFVPIPPATPLSLVAAAGQSIPSTVTPDLLGLGVGIAPQSIIGAQSPIFGEDPGLGGTKGQVEVIIGTAFATSNSATLNVALQAAPDPGSAGNYTPTTWTTLVETGPIAASSLTANAIIARFDFPPAMPAGQRPRFFRLYFQVPAGTNFTAGTIAGAFVTFVRDDQQNRYLQRNYSVS